MNENKEGFGQGKQGQQADTGNITGQDKSQQFGQEKDQEFGQDQDQQFGQDQDQQYGQDKQQQLDQSQDEPQASGDKGPAFFPEAKPGQDETGGKPGWSEKGEKGSPENEDIEAGTGGDSSDTGGGRY